MMRKQQLPLQSSKKQPSQTEISKSVKPKQTFKMTKQTTLIKQKKVGININEKLNKNILSLIFGFFSCQDCLNLRLVCKLWNDGSITYIKFQKKLNPLKMKKALLEDKYSLSKINEEIKFVPEELKEIYCNLDTITPDEIYTPDNEIRSVYPIFNLFFSLIIQFNILKPKHSNLIENNDWRIGYVQVFIDKVILKERIEKQYTIRKFLRIFNRVNLEKFKKELSQIRWNFINLIQYIPPLCKKMELFLRESIKFYEDYKQKYPHIVEYMEVISDLENNRKEIIIINNIHKKYS